MTHLIDERNHVYGRLRVLSPAGSRVFGRSPPMLLRPARHRHCPSICTAHGPKQPWSVRPFVSNARVGTAVDPHRFVAFGWAMVTHASGAPGRGGGLAADGSVGGHRSLLRRQRIRREGGRR
jgi:hypothetical protein